MYNVPQLPPTVDLTQPTGPLVPPPITELSRDLYLCYLFLKFLVPQFLKNNIHRVVQAFVNIKRVQGHCCIILHLCRPIIKKKQKNKDR